jgi:hypothetical protein
MVPVVDSGRFDVLGIVRVSATNFFWTELYIMSAPARPQTDPIEPINTPAPASNVIERPYAEDEAPEIKNRGGNNPVTETAKGISGRVQDKASQAKDALTPDNSHTIKETREVKVSRS